MYVDEVAELCRTAETVGDLPPWEALVVWLHRFVAYVAAKRAISEALNHDSEMFLSRRRAIYAAGEPLMERAQAAGEARADVSFDDVLRMLTGITATGFVSDEQRDRVLSIALDGVRSHADHR